MARKKDEGGVAPPEFEPGDVMTPTDAEISARAAREEVGEDDPPPGRQDETTPGGRYIQGATEKGGKLYGGAVVDAEGRVLHQFQPGQENTGKVPAASQKKFEKATGDEE